MTSRGLRYYNEHQRPKRAAARAAKAEAWSRPVTGMELAWAAGHFEGEGTVSILKGGRDNNFRPIVTLASTDVEVIQFFCQRWPATSICQRIPNPNARLVYTWRVASAIRVAKFLSQIRPYLQTTRVKAKAEVVAEFCTQMLAVEYNREGDKSWKLLRVAKIRAMNRRGVEA